jgi:hypothetical protein
MTEDARERTFDELASALANGTISRRRALKLAGAAMLGSTGLLAFFPRKAAAQTLGGCPEDEPAISDRRCPTNECGPADCPSPVLACLCAVTVSGKKRCVNFQDVLCPASDQCDSNADCEGEEVCIKMGGCCEGRRRNACLSPCPKECPT